jgi:hypothetical protein
MGALPIPEGMEPTRLRSIRGFAIGILAGLVLASAGVASAKQGRGLGPSPEVISLVTDEPDVTDACVEEAEVSDDVPDLTSEGDESEESDEGESEESDEGEQSDEECPPVEEEQESDEDDSEPTTESGDRQAECEEAAGLSESEEVPDLTSEEGEDGSEGEEEVKGLDHAIEVVLANCLKNPQAPGLLNALRHLAENRERKMAHDEAKAERKAAHAHGNSHKP